MEQKKKNMMDKLIDGDWIDSMTDNWGKPKKVNKEWADQNDKKDETAKKQ